MRDYLSLINLRKLVTALIVYIKLSPKAIIWDFGVSVLVLYKQRRLDSSL